VTAFFFLGSEETFNRQLADLPEFFLRRIGGGIAIGILGCIIVGAGNLLFDSGQRTDKRVRIYKIVLLTLFLSIATSVIGTWIFFYK
jgi:hypothetical protein